MTDLSTTIAPNSQQLNADDLIAGPRTIRITGVKQGNAEQPIAIRYEGDDGKPYYPCKSMRRLLVGCWGPKGDAYTGRLLTLYRDPSVKWGGIEIGGIRISHMSDIDSDVTMALTETRGKRSPYRVKRLVSHPVPTSDFDLDRLLTAIRTCSDRDAAMALAKAAGVPGGLKKQVMGVIEEVFPVVGVKED